MAVLLQLTEVSKSYGALKAVDTLSLSVDDGEALGVIGPNGAGKTTLFNLISGDVAPTAGRIVFAGASASGAPIKFRTRSPI
jgi:branched-chain amino acid transport system ATP-binding protein